MSFQIIAYNESHRTKILEVWERSVLKTHHFLTKEDFEEIKALVNSIDFKAFTTYCLMDESKVAGFIGLTESKIEMLFLHPDYIGKGLGQKLMQFALHNLKATEVDVNEQNIHAVEFYKRFGFEVYERMAKDSMGKNYPILKMRL